MTICQEERLHINCRNFCRCLTCTQLEWSLSSECWKVHYLSQTFHPSPHQTAPTFSKRQSKTLESNEWGQQGIFLKKNKKTFFNCSAEIRETWHTCARSFRLSWKCNTSCPADMASTTVSSSNWRHWKTPQDERLFFLFITYCSMTMRLDDVRFELLQVCPTWLEQCAGKKQNILFQQLNSFTEHTWEANFSVCCWMSPPDGKIPWFRNVLSDSLKSPLCLRGNITKKQHTNNITMKV